MGSRRIEPPWRDLHEPLGVNIGLNVLGETLADAANSLKLVCYSTIIENPNMKVSIFNSTN